MSTETLLVRLEVPQGPLNSEIAQIIGSKEAFSLAGDNEGSRPNLIVLVLTGEAEPVLKMVQEELEKDRVDEVFLVSSRSDPALLTVSMRAGVREFFTLPLVRDDFVEALDRFRKRYQRRSGAQQGKQGKIISTIGSKGGVGTTTVSVNLAAALAERGDSVVLMDMNIAFGEIPMFLDIKPSFHWGDIAENIERLDDTFLLNILTEHSSGVHVLPSPNYLNKEGAADTRIMQVLLRQMRSLFDYVIIDNGQSTDEIGLMIYQTSDQVLLIAIQSLPCLANTTRLYRSLLDYVSMDEDRLHVILNRYVVKSDLSLSAIESSINTGLFWVIPNDYRATMAAINTGNLIASVAPRSKIARSFTDLADELFPKAEEESRRSWLSLFRR